MTFDVTVYLDPVRPDDVSEWQWVKPKSPAAALFEFRLGIDEVNLAGLFVRWYLRRLPQTAVTIRLVEQMRFPDGV